MMPENILSSTPIISGLLYPKNIPVVGLEAYDIGGVDLNDSSEGLLVKAWRSYADSAGDVYIEAVGHPASFVFSAPGISEMSLTFDRNMNVFIAFVQDGQAKFYWFDSLTSSYQITDLPVGSTTPRASLDDKRTFANSYSDIILVYIDDGNLYQRLQRDRYLIQYLLYADINVPIIDPQIVEVGMGVNMRFQLQIVGAFFPV